MGTIGWMVVGALALLVVMFVMNPQAVKNMFGAGRAQVGKLGHVVKNADPLANAQQLVDDAATSLRDQLEAQETADTTVTQLERQVNDNTAELTKLEFRLKKAIADNDEAKQTRTALEIDRVEKLLAQNKAQLSAAQQNLTKVAKLVDANRNKLKDARDKARRMGMELKQSQVMAEAAAKFASVTGTDVFEGMDSAFAQVQERIDKNNAKMKVAQQASQGTLDDLEEEEAARKEAAASIIARFKPQTPATATAEG